MSYQWKASSLDYTVSQNGLSNVVTVVHWACFKEDENGNSGYAYGSYSLPDPDRDNFVAWDDLDEFTVLSWMTSDMVAKADGGGESEVDRVQALVDAQIAEQANPTHGTGVPW